jgi:hypothetical protein
MRSIPTGLTLASRWEPSALFTRYLAIPDSALSSGAALAAAEPGKRGSKYSLNPRKRD